MALAFLSAERSKDPNKQVRKKRHRHAGLPIQMHDPASIVLGEIG
jgi:hypothetical protein